MEPPGGRFAWELRQGRQVSCAPEKWWQVRRTTEYLKHDFNRLRDPAPTVRQSSQNLGKAFYEGLIRRTLMKINLYPSFSIATGTKTASSWRPSSRSMSVTSGTIATPIRLYEVINVSLVQVDPAPLSMVLCQVPRLRDPELPLPFPKLLGHWPGNISIMLSYAGFIP